MKDMKVTLKNTLTLQEFILDSFSSALSEYSKTQCLYIYFFFKVTSSINICAISIIINNVDKQKDNQHSVDTDVKIINILI